MNRAQRRAKNKQQAIKTVPLPRMIDEFTVFDPIDRILNSIKDDSVLMIDNQPSVLGPHGKYIEIIPNLKGWIFTWRKIEPSLDLSSLEEINHCLYHEKPIPLGVVHGAISQIQACRAVFRSKPRDEVQSLAKTAQIAIMMELDE